MNFLAHLYLSDGTAESMLGSLLPDFVKGKLDPSLPDAMRRGVELHRAVDRFTDAHPQFLTCRRLLAPAWGRYTGILVDVLWDHVLARDWDRYSPMPLEAFTAHVYDGLFTFTQTLQARDERYAANPGVARLSHAVTVMIEQDWLTSYRTVDGIARTLSRMSDRLGHGIRLEPAAEMFRDATSEADAMTDDFHAFFPLLVEHARAIDPAAVGWAPPTTITDSPVGSAHPTGAITCPPPVPSPTGS